MIRNTTVNDIDGPNCITASFIGNFNISISLSARCHSVGDRAITPAHAPNISQARIVFSVIDL